MLLCGVLCACGGSLPGVDAEAIVTLPAAPAEQREHKHHCHGHGSEGHAGHGQDEIPSDGEGQKPEPCHDGGGHSCSHCQSTATIVSETGKHTANLNPLSHYDGTILPAAFAVPACAANSARWPRPGDPSPPPAPTLLSLHCALNT